MTYQAAFDAARKACSASRVPVYLLQASAYTDSPAAESYEYGTRPMFTYFMPLAVVVATFRPLSNGVEVVPGQPTSRG